MKKIIVSIMIISLSLTSSIVSVNAIGDNFEANQKQMKNLPETNDQVEYWVICAGLSLGHREYAQMTKEVLCAHGLKEENIKVFIAENMTKNNFFNALNWINNSADDNDILLLWFFSHGDRERICFYKESLYFDELDEKLDVVCINKMGLFISTCHSGSAIPYLNQSGRIIITSGKADETTGTIIDHCLCALQGFGGILQNNDNKVSFEDMYYFLMRHQDTISSVPQMADNIPGELNITVIDESDQNPDQFQYLFYNSRVPINYNFKHAQSFIPTINKINKVTLFLGKRGHPGTLKISIRKELDGDDLTYVKVPEGPIQGINGFSIHWEYPWIAHDFYLPEIDITPGEKYYIVCEANEVNRPYNEYFIAKSSHDPFDAYKNGKSFMKVKNEKWREDTSNDDLCFATFYIEELP